MHQYLFVVLHGLIGIRVVASASIPAIRFKDLQEEFLVLQNIASSVPNG
jgi:hypothetical protein